MDRQDMQNINIDGPLAPQLPGQTMDHCPANYPIASGACTPAVPPAVWHSAAAAAPSANLGHIVSSAQPKGLTAPPVAPVAHAVPVAATPAPYYHQCQQGDTLPVDGLWSTGLFDCDGCGCTRGCTSTCCVATFCGCFLYGQIVGALKPKEACCGGNEAAACCGYVTLEMAPNCVFWGTMLSLAASGVVGWEVIRGLNRTRIPGCSCFVHQRTRKAIRERYNIPGTDCEDCCTTWCCSCCALIQEKQELERRGVFYERFVQQQPATAIPSMENTMPQK